MKAKPRIDAVGWKRITAAEERVVRAAVRWANASDAFNASLKRPWTKRELALALESRRALTMLLRAARALERERAKAAASAKATRIRPWSAKHDDIRMPRDPGVTKGSKK